jgi:hypothetical protein
MEELAQATANAMGAEITADFLAADDETRTELAAALATECLRKRDQMAVQLLTDPRKMKDFAAIVAAM